MGIGTKEFQVWIILFCTPDHLFREIKPHAACRMESGQQVTFGTSDLKHIQIWVYMELIDFLEAVVIPLSHAVPRVALAGDGIPVRHPGLLVGLSCRVE